MPVPSNMQVQVPMSVLVLVMLPQHFEYLLDTTDARDIYTDDGC